LPNSSKVPFTGVTANDALNANGFWYQVEYVKGKLGWISADYSKKIKAPEKLTTSLTAKQESNESHQVEEVQPVAEVKENNGQHALRSNDIVKKSVVETKKDSAPVESKGFFKNLFSSKPTQKSKNPAQKEQATAEKSLAVINGFRSAKFGMGRAEVTKAIFKDFGIASGKITIIKHPTEQTESLGIMIDNLLPNSGKSQVVYVFGYKSKRLMQVNIVTGHPFDTDVTPQQVVNAGNLLGNYFFKKRYQEDGLVAHARLSDGSVMIFRGQDQKGRMALLRLVNTQQNNKNNEVKLSLNLSYIEKPGQPDIYQLKEEDF